MSLYAELLKKGKDAIEAMELPFKVKKEKKNLEMKILELEQSIAKDELTIQEQKSKCPVKWDDLCEAIDNREINERKLKQLQAIEIELFGKQTQEASSSIKN